ncbi:L,D-transpeptidase [Saccharopolyspora spinosporotrichia]
MGPGGPQRDHHHRRRGDPARRRRHAPDVDRGQRRGAAHHPGVAGQARVPVEQRRARGHRAPRNQDHGLLHLRPAGRGRGYRTPVSWAVRISNGGEFLHAAPWSVGDQGRRNVSHGCINMSMSDAKWVYDLLKKGDVVEITNAGGPSLRSWDGFGDWQIPWEEWSRGNR